MKKKHEITFFPCGKTFCDTLARYRDLKKIEKLQISIFKPFFNTKNTNVSSEIQWNKSNIISNLIGYFKIKSKTNTKYKIKSR